MSTPNPLRSTTYSLGGTYTTPRPLTSTYASQGSWTQRNFSTTTTPREQTQGSPERNRQFQSQIEDEIKILSSSIDAAETEQATQLEKITKQLNAVSETLKQQKGGYSSLIYTLLLTLPLLYLFDYYSSSAYTTGEKKQRPLNHRIFPSA